MKTSPSPLSFALFAAFVLQINLFCQAQPLALFDGKTLDGWDYDPSMWRVEDGVITGGSTNTKIAKNDFISTKKSYANFELKLKIKCSGDPKTGLINSGIQIRSVREGSAMKGYQIDCGAGWFGKIYDEHRRNKVIAEPLDVALLGKAVDVFGWNEYRIRAEGPRIQTWINGIRCIDYTETDPSIALDGLIAPQVHSGGVCLVQVKDVTIEELPATPNAPTWKSLEAKNPSKRDTSYNNVQGTALSAQEQLKKFRVSDGYEIELVVQESEGLGKFVSVYFDQRGRLWTQTALEYPIDSNENPAAAEAVYASKGKDKVLVYSREAVNGTIPEVGLTNPTVFADGLAIPLGILPWGNGDTCYVQHGHDLKLFKDTNSDGKADTLEVVLTGFGVQDSHLFPHQFTRAPGGWIWMAQGLFNNSKVHKPGSDVTVDWPKCGMARMRPDGSEFEVTCIGPNNIWGLVITGEGETFIQEANDYGYPVMPFHEYAYYPGGMEALKKSYQPDFPPTAEFRMGGTGLSGLALLEDGPLVVRASARSGSVEQRAEARTTNDHTMLVANPITSKIQTIAMHRDGSYWKLEQLPDLITCDDPFFRPVALTNGPDGCIYIVDWYNKIISHNEVPRAHPDRDKTRGRIWRIRPVVPALAGSDPAKAGTTKQEVPDFTKLSNEDLIALLGTEPFAKAHLAWQTLTDRGMETLPESVRKHWAFINTPQVTAMDQIKALGRSLNTSPDSIAKLLTYAKPSLPGPLGQSSRGAKQIPIREAYDREFERFLVRMFLERHPELVATFLDSEAAAKLPVEALVLASLALEPKNSASRVARLLPKLDRAPNDEELLRLAQFPAEPGVGEALRALLTDEKSRTVVVENLLAQRTKLDEAQLAPLLTETAKSLLRTAPQVALQLIGGFKLASLESELIELTKKNALNETSAVEHRRSLLHALRDLRSADTELFSALAESDPDPVIRDAALEALAASRAPDAGARLIKLYPGLKPVQQRTALNMISSTKTGAKAIVTALLDKSLPQGDLDGPTIERLATVLGDDPAILQLQHNLGGIFHEVIALDGSDTAWVDSKITLDGPFTVEAWVRLAPGIGNEDGLLGTPGGIDMNFFGSKLRVYAGSELKDVVVATKPMTPDLWTHVAVTRDAQGICRIYQNGELDATDSKPAPQKFENCRLGWSGPAKGTEGMITEFRVWKIARSPQEIRATFDRTVVPALAGVDLIFSSSIRLKPELPYGKGARLAKTTDYPPLLSPEQSEALDRKFARYMELGQKKGNLEQGKLLSALCLTCHQIGNTGGQIGPNLSGAGAMGLEAVARNILTPNAAMEPGYRIFRVELNSGDIIEAFYLSEDKEAIIIRQAGLPDQRLSKKEIKRTSYIRRSLMPEGLLDALNDEQLKDLLSYLMSLKG
jgi:putative membrane-bound dehydrogenase-like protein